MYESKGNLRDRGNGKYQATVTIGSDYRGEPNRYYKTFKASSIEEAEKKLAVFYNECQKKNVQVSTKLTFEEFTKIWDKEYAKVQLKKSTYVSDIRNLKKNFDMLNKKKLNAIKPFHVRQWVTYLSTERGLSPKTVRNNYSLLRSILHKAVVWEYLTSNPAENVELPKPKKKEANYYNTDEVSNLLTVLSNVPEKYINYKVAILIGLFGGLRRGEIFGIDESNIDFETSTVKIAQTRMIYGSGGLYEDTPKTIQSARTISLPVQIMNEIKALLEYQNNQKKIMPDLWQGSPALLKNEIGAPLYPPSLYRWFMKLQKANDLPHLSVHGLRHTHTSMLRDCDMKLEEVSRRLGHSQKTTTLNIYSHLFTDKDTELSKKLGERFLE